MPKGFGYGPDAGQKGPKMSYSPNKMGHSPAEMGHSPAEMSAELKYNPVVDIDKGKAKGDIPFTNKHFGSKSAAMMKGPMEMGHSPAEMGHSPNEMKGSPNHKYDRVVLGGNKGDKSKTKPGKKDY